MYLQNIFAAVLEKVTLMCKNVVNLKSYFTIIALIYSIHLSFFALFVYPVKGAGACTS